MYVIALITSIVKIVIISHWEAPRKFPVFETLGGASSTEMKQRQEDTNNAYISEITGHDLDAFISRWKKGYVFVTD
jgi:hypothetical protein